MLSTVFEFSVAKMMALVFIQGTCLP